MLGKQLNFRHIFDHNSEDKDLGKKEVQKNEGNLENIKNSSETKQDNVIDPERLVILKEILNKTINKLSFSDFSNFKSELEFYKQRILSFKKEYRDFDKNLDPYLLKKPEGREKAQKEKEELYKKIVFPGTGDLPKYRDLSKLYFRFKDFLKEEAKKKYENIPSKRNFYKKKSLKGIPQNKKSRELSADEEYDEDSPDPWGDIHPYSQAKRKKKE